MTTQKQDRHEILETMPANGGTDRSLSHSESSTDTPASQPRIMERLLSKRSLDLMMLSGGGLLVIGFAVWLWSIGVFENALILAGSVGALNLALIGVGLWMVLATHYKVSGRGLLLLGSLVLPLNLWLYDSQGLIPIDAGGQLWIPAMIISAIYAVIARLTRDSLFVYTFVGGVLLTGTLFIAGATVSALPLASLFIATALVCLHADAWFLENDGDFSRDRFGLAFFRSGLTAMASGLGILLTGRVATVMSQLSGYLGHDFLTPDLMSRFGGQLWSVVLLVSAIYGCLYLHFSKRKHWTISFAGVFLLGWAAAIGLDMLNLRITFQIGLLLVAGALALVNMVYRWALPKSMYRDHAIWTAVIAGLALAISVGNYFLLDTIIAQVHVVDWVRPAQMFLSSLALLTLPGVWRSSNPAKRGLVSIGSAGLTLSLIAALWMFHPAAAGIKIAYATALPVFVGIAFLVLISTDLRDALGSSVVASVATVMFAWITLLVLDATVIFHSVPSMALVLLLLICCAVVGMSVGNRSATSFGGVLFLLLAVQMFAYFDLVNGFAITIFLAILGVMLVVAGRWFGNSKSDVGPRLLHTGNGMVLLGATGAVLFTCFAQLGAIVGPAHLGLLTVQLGALGLSALCTNDTGWRQVQFVAASITACAGVLVVVNLSTLTVLQRVEIGALIAGGLLTIAGYIGWSREEGERSDAVTASLFLGSLTLILPLTVGLIGDRFDGSTAIDSWRYLHEIGSLVVGLLLLGTGVVAQVRSTTLAGTWLLLVTVVSNILLIEFPEQLQQTSVLMMIGGGTFFGMAVLLSVYRERLMRLPEKMKEGKGIFKVLKWR